MCNFPIVLASGKRCVLLYDEYTFKACNSVIFHKAFEVQMALRTTTQNRGMRGMDTTNPDWKIPNWTSKRDSIVFTVQVRSYTTFIKLIVALERFNQQWKVHCLWPKLQFPALEQTLKSMWEVILKQILIKWWETGSVCFCATPKIITIKEGKQMGRGQGGVWSKTP